MFYHVLLLLHKSMPSTPEICLKFNSDCFFFFKECVEPFFWKNVHCNLQLVYIAINLFIYISNPYDDKGLNLSK